MGRDPAGSTKPPLSAPAALAMAKAKAYRDAADAPSTLRAYATDLKAYETWCARSRLTSLPATPEIVGAYLAAAGEGYANSTLRRRVAAIARASALAGGPLDTKHPAIRETLRGIARTHGARGRRAAALTTTEIRQLVAGSQGRLAELRDRALLLVGFAGALRRSEIVALDVEHVTWLRTGFRLLIAKSKTDGEGRGAAVLITHGDHSETCPVRALRAWLDAATISQGPIFRKVARGGHVQPHRLSEDGVRQIVRKRAAAAGLQGSREEFLGPHGLRAGFITTAYDNGVPDEEIMGHTRHRSLATMRTYVRRSKLSGGQPTSGKVDL
jgi:integrase